MNSILSIVIPIYNEEKIAADYLPTIFALPIKKEIIIVNDGSTDDSYNIAKALATEYSNIKIKNITRSPADS